MKGLLSITGIVLLYTVFALSSCAMQEEMKPSPTPVAKAPEAKPPIV
jgi:hypothetical protein